MILENGLIRTLDPQVPTQRALAIAGGAPAGLTCISLGTDGPRGGALVLGTAAFAAALVLLAAAVRRVPAGPPGAPDDGLDAAVLDRAPETGGTLVVTFERWVIDATWGAFAVGARALSWTVARFDLWMAR